MFKIHKRKMEKMYFVDIKMFCSVKGPVKRRKWLTTDREKMSVNHASDTGLDKHRSKFKSQNKKQCS